MKMEMRIKLFVGKTIKKKRSDQSFSFEADDPVTKEEKWIINTEGFCF